MNTTHLGLLGVAAVVVCGAAIRAPVLRDVYRNQESTSAATADGDAKSARDETIEKLNETMSALGKQVEQMKGELDKQANLTAASVPPPEQTQSVDSPAIDVLNQKMETLLALMEQGVPGGGSMGSPIVPDVIPGGPPENKIGVQFDPTTGQLAYYSAAGIPLWAKSVPGTTYVEQLGKVILLSPSGQQFDVETGLPVPGLLGIDRPLPSPPPPTPSGRPIWPIRPKVIHPGGKNKPCHGGSCPKH